VKSVAEVLAALAEKGSASIKKTLVRHGAVEPLFGVKIGNLKPMIKLLKGQQNLALQLYATKNSDAMYLAGLVANGALMTAEQLDAWAAGARWNLHAGSTVPGVAAEHPLGLELAMKWIDAKDPLVAVAGWATLAAIASVWRDEQLPMPELKKLLLRCVKTLHSSPNYVRSAMNGFIICLGTYVEPLGEFAVECAQKIGKVDVDVGDTACQIPDAVSYIEKCRRGAAVAPKKKTAKC
jgi:3-methyladenine DNA glycosylase AlkD